MLTAFTVANGAPRPFASVIANEVFSSGVLLSEYAALDAELLETADFLTLARTSANLSNISRFRVSTYVVLLSPSRTSPIFVFELDGRYREQLYISHTSGTAHIQVMTL